MLPSISVFLVNPVPKAELISLVERLGGQWIDSYDPGHGCFWIEVTGVPECDWARADCYAPWPPEKLCDEEDLRNATVMCGAPPQAVVVIDVGRNQASLDLVNRVSKRLIESYGGWVDYEDYAFDMGFW